MMSAFKAVIFDLGGVLYPFRDYSKFQRITARAAADPWIKEKLTGWQEGKYPVSEIQEFIVDAFGELPPNCTDLENINFDEVVGPKHEKIWAAIEQIKKHGLKVALLTNNGWWTPRKGRTVICDDLSLFDVVVESCKEGICKPHPKIFQTTLKRLGLEGPQCLFVDDLPKNIEGARKLGIHGIQMIDQNQDLVVHKLEQALQLPLRNIPPYSINQSTVSQPIARL
ncbi:unnamed protein product [Bursaphelenchus xylophilus]|uniref:(pine wood nematode) hypothetical protein n=1 Tax=Bursaphelenchus xylophilus TaxID=6326 RepID=A0A1I7SSK8_BURXY|nr:unnamed protein product [Bursaphelenchus xylophilus]CAG9097447.1 unnamed protein product [Bursaphelenchus xylophilus]